MSERFPKDMLGIKMRPSTATELWHFHCPYYQFIIIFSPFINSDNINKTQHPLAKIYSLTKWAYVLQSGSAQHPKASPK